MLKGKSPIAVRRRAYSPEKAGKTGRKTGQA
jgi:hypothetical protein